MHTRRTVLRGAGLAGLSVAGVGTAMAKRHGNDGNDRYDRDGNGIPDEGAVVTGMYKARYAYDANGDWYGYNLSGRELESGTVDGVDALDAATLTRCSYKVQYRGTFGNDPYMDSGWIRNNVVCTGYEPDNQNVLFVHETDPRYTGDPDRAIWGTWEYFVDSQRGKGNTLVTDRVRP